MKQKISISISKKLLESIEKNIEGKSRSEKVTKCARAGYKILTSEVK